jgi:hypothetical protein
MAHNNEGKIKIGYIAAIIAAIVAIVVFCVVSVVFKTMPIDALPANYMGAALGSLIGALITLVLLRGQTDIEEKKGKDIEILKRKTEIFQQFINVVWKIWEDRVITVEEFQNLTSQYYQNLMIYLKGETLKKIGNALTEMGRQIDKNTYDDMVKLRTSIVTIIDTLSAEIDLGGKIDTEIMDEHDKIMFPVLFKKTLLNTLNKELNTNDSASEYKKGNYEFIKEGQYHLEYITFELNRFPGIKLVIGPIGENFRMVFMADERFQQIDKFRHPNERRAYFRRRFGPQTDPLRDNEDKTPIPVLDFSKEESMKKFRGEGRDFPNVLAKWVQFHLREWKLEELGIIEFLEKYLGQNGGTHA